MCIRARVCALSRAFNKGKAPRARDASVAGALSDLCKSVGAHLRRGSSPLRGKREREIEREREKEREKKTEGEMEQSASWQHQKQCRHRHRRDKHAFIPECAACAKRGRASSCGSARVRAAIRPRSHRDASLVRGDDA